MEKYHFTSEERAHMEMSRMPFAIYQFIDKRVVTCILSAGFCELFGYDDLNEAYQVMDHNMYRDTHPDDAARIADAAFQFATQDGTYEVIYRSRNQETEGYHIIHARGEHLYMENGARLAQVWYTDEGAYVEGMFSKETELNEALNRALHRESILHTNYYDYLTGLPSMTYFFELADAGKDVIIQQGGCPVLLFFDLSGLKFYNREYGFAKGDQALRSFAHLLKRYFSNENCSRLGQDHFAAFTKREGLEDILQEFFRDWKNNQEGGDLPVRVGAYLKREEDVDIAGALDRAKYACDSLRKSYASYLRFYNDGMLLDAEKAQYIVANLDKAMEEHWIQVYYQPLMRAVNGKVCDEEALARWIDPVRGSMSPAEFIPALEDARLIYKLDLYVLEQVLEKNRYMHDRGLQIVPQSINLSRTDFDTCDIVEEIRKRVDGAGFDRSLFSIEITESVIGQDLDFMKERIMKFRELGFPVWMDDFGSGYSSLDVLQSIPFDLIKFDMRFMQQFHQGDKGKIILTELMKMVISLGIDSVCEGVEEEEQVEFLREIGCTKLQGYYYEKPIPLETILEKYDGGKGILFENPEETSYFDSISRINLYDLSGIVNREENDFRHYFNTLPMAIMEYHDGQIRFVRTNQSYREFMFRTLKDPEAMQRTDFRPTEEVDRAAFMERLRICCETGERVVIDETLPDNVTIHSFLRRVAINEVTGTTAVAIAVLAVTDSAQAEHIED